MVQTDQATGGLYDKCYAFVVKTFSIERKRERVKIEETKALESR